MISRMINILCYVLINENFFFIILPEKLTMLLTFVIFLEKRNLEVRCIPKYQPSAAVK